MSSNNMLLTLRALGAETTNADLANACQHIEKSLHDKSMELQDVIQTLSEYVTKFEDAKLFRKYFSNILLALVSTKIPLKPVFSHSNFDSCNDGEKISHLENSVALAVMSDHPDILQYALKYFEINKVPPFEVFIHHEDSYNVAPKKRRLLDCRQKITDHHIVSCCYILLSKLPNELSSKWDWTKFINNFCNHKSDEVRWMVKECMVIITNMTEAQSKILSKNLNLTDLNYPPSVVLNHSEIYMSEENISNVDLSACNVVNIDGIMLPFYDKDNVQPSNLVPVKSTMGNLRSLGLAVASGKAVCLMGPVGSGKTTLVEHLANITGRKNVAFKKVQLGDQTDSRMLLGSHQCTDIPGEFIWRPGVLTEAVQNGHWLLLEDIDSAALDVASTLSSLLERNALCVPGYRDSLPVTPGFQLFVTQRIMVTSHGIHRKLTNSSTLLQKHLALINVEPLSWAELEEIIQVVYPTLSSISQRILKVFMMFSVGKHDTSIETSPDCDNIFRVIRGSRLISTRDLMKWCSRAVVGYDVTSSESALKVLQDALDIFTCSIPSPDNRLELAKKVGTLLGIVETKSEYYCKHYKPNVSLNPIALVVGRAKVTRKEKSLESIDFDNKQVVFSFTRQSALLLERIACCVTSNEPVLLVGETGTGKTSSIQYLAKQTGHKLVVINMNQQSDSADLLGGYKPVDIKIVIRPIRNVFEELFRSFYNVEKNQKFLCHIETCYDTENWTALLALMKQSHKAAVKRLTTEKRDQKVKRWVAFGQKLSKLEQQIKTASRLTFAFIEGSLVKAMQEGYWVLLDEINLASPEILECLAGLLEDKNDTIELLEKGDKVPIKRHPEFTLFACMNPATDVGKKDLPAGLRNRFTEFFVDELTERNDLTLLIGDYLYHMNLSGSVLEAIYNFYATIRKEAKLNLVDGAGNAPHYSLRTLCRALTAAAKAKCGTVSRSLYEAFCLSFLSQLDNNSHPKVEAMIAKAVIGKKSLKSVLNQLIPEPQIQGQSYLLFEGHWVPQGQLEIDIPDSYILTPTVRKNLRDIARIISLGRLPILLQGDTSVGKTSLISYIAKASGNFCVRINNHEHTDLQEYIGSYATDASGKLVFKEGVLVEAMRKGYWIILDELNLAPSDVLEALNRVLDDNRELFIPETQQVVKADPNFMLFATQNPPGLYGGRKMLSRAFRNRFVELHFDEIPRNELETILHQRCHVPPTYCKKMIAVMAELQVRRRGSAAVQGKDGFITLRDLFRWGQRYKHASKFSLAEHKFYDWDQHIADEGYLILAGKVRQPDERKIIEEVLEKHIKRKVSPENLFSLHQETSLVTKPFLEMLLTNDLEEFSHVVWTYNMRRLAVLIAKAFNFDEPVLLVGETGCGKTTICQVLAMLKKNQLLSVNCHMHTESSDFLGGLRPVRQYQNDGRLFEWVDGPLIKAMQNGNLFLADEISLADDSVLERLNSLLEPERQLVLAEKGMDDSDVLVAKAEKDFHFIGTMNPGGDFGKKELSPALRNRFTEIWCDNFMEREDLLKVLEKSVAKGISLGNQEDGSSGIGNFILDFIDWLKKLEVTSKFPFSIRDLLSWVQFINITVANKLLDTPEAYVHGACMTFLDCFGTALTGHIDSESLYSVRSTAINFLLNQIKTIGNEYTEGLAQMLSNKQTKFIAETDDIRFGIRPFYIETGSTISTCEENQTFEFTAPTTGSNTLRLLRGLQLNKAILLEGNPGVGKTSLVSALAKASGHKVVRINLSDQTDITDLFGTDLPTEDGSFAFHEGIFLNALQNGDWILLDELNLAPQPVLEGLNACLDHRGEIYIPELGKTFKVKQETRLFACQNPLKQGGARRGLPLSFLNRFTQVYVDTLTKEDLLFIVEAQFSELPQEILHKIVEFNCKISHEIIEVQTWGHRGGPWEMNLRDIQRWCDALIKDQDNRLKVSPGKFVDMLYVNRMRTLEDKEKMTQAYDEIFCPKYPRTDRNPQFYMTESEAIIGNVHLKRNIVKQCKSMRPEETTSLILRNQLPTLKTLAQSTKMNWLTILVGSTATGKSKIIQVLADITNNNLQILPVTSAMDISDLLGGFEQVDYNRNLEVLYDKIETITLQTVRNIWLTQKSPHWRTNNLLTKLFQYKSTYLNIDKNIDSNENVNTFNEKIKFLIEHCENQCVHYKIEDTTYNRLNNIINYLKTLQSRVSNARSVTAGGKFEWVDSLLVKAMLNGSWLLLDNVNLTSAAILDRLNGLFEPNGFLNIPERGAISEIRPHSNFRVFFTMDPKFGEISRAMRNRGVEIFLMGPEDKNINILESVPNLDLAALISSCGLPSQYHANCMDYHKRFCNYVRGYDDPTITHVLQATYLMWQQMVRGLPYKTALLNSFSDVYVKPVTGSDFTAESAAVKKSVMLDDLHKCLSFKKDKRHSVIEPNNCGHTLTVKGLCSNALYETAKSIAFVAIQQSLDGPSNLELSLYFLYSLYTALLKCPIESYNVLRDMIEQSLYDNKNKNSDKSKEIVRQLNNDAYAFLKKCDKYETFQRFYSESHNMDDKHMSPSNTKSIMLYNELWKSFSKIFLSENIFSALDYSKSVLSGKLSDDFVHFPILKNCQRYIKIIDDNIEAAIKCAENSLDDATTCQIMQLLNWRNRFLKICSLPIFVKNKSSFILKEHILPLLYMHSKWLQKYLLEQLFSHSPNTNLREKFKNEVRFSVQHEDHENTDFVKLSKKQRKLEGQPKLYENQKEYDLCCIRLNIYKELTLDTHQPLVKQLHKLSLYPDIFDATLALDVPEANIKTVQNNIEGFKREAITPAIEIEIKLLPVNVYVIHRILILLKSVFLDITTKLSLFGEEKIEIGTEYSEVLKYLVNTAKVTRGFAPAFLNLLLVLEKLQFGDLDRLKQRLSSVSVTFWDAYYKSIVNSPALYPLPFFGINNKSDSEILEQQIPSRTRRLSESISLLPYYIQKLTISDGDSGHLLAFDTVSLQDRAGYSSQLDTLLNIVWKNIAVLDTAAGMKLKTDAAFEMKKYELFVNYLHSTIVLTDSEELKPLENIFEVTTQQLREYFKGQHTYVTDIMLEANKIFHSLSELLKIENLNANEHMNGKVLTAELSVLTSLLSMKINSEMNAVDHVEKYRLKVEYIEEDVKIFEALLSSYYMHGLVSGSITNTENIEKASDVPIEYFKDKNDNREMLKKVHPYCPIILELKEKTAEKIHKYAAGNTFRPKDPAYGSFVKECKHFVKSVLSPKTIKDLAENLQKTCNRLFENSQNNINEKNTIQNARIGTKEISSWLYSVNVFYKKIEATYSEAFPDLAKPLLKSLAQLVYSFSVMNDLIKELIVKIEQGPHLNEIVADLMIYPNCIPNREAKKKYLTRFIESNLIQLINKNVIAANSDPINGEIQCFEVLKMNLAELKMHCIAAERADKTTFECVMATLDLVVKAWEKQQQDIERKKQDDEALYVTKSKCEDIDEETEAIQEISEIFPSHSDTDFSEFKPTTLEQTNTKVLSDAEKKKPKQLLSPEDVSLIYKWHSNFVRDMTAAEWLFSPKKSSGIDVVSSFIQRYPLFSRVIENAWETLDAEFEGNISPSFLVLVSQIKEKVDGNESAVNKGDFYHSPWISETKQCVPLLREVKDKTNELLDQWPDFPTLKDIIVIVDRILGFPVTSPVSRFLTGLELLRDKVEEWNKNAHKGNNMIDISLAIGQQIVNWRKLEMSNWKECLNRLFQKKQSEAHKYWFYMYSVVNFYLYDTSEESEQRDSTKRVISVLREFMEKSNLAEYDVRLDIIYVYHCHLVHLERSPKRDELLSILWNTYNYYSQFSSQVASSIKDKRATIEKKLRDFVKICTWDRDLSYWSVKDTVEKAHKALHKHIKEFENVLKESVVNCLVDNGTEAGTDHVGIWDRPKRATGANVPTGGAYMIDHQNHVILARNVKKYLDQAEEQNAIIEVGSLLNKISSLLNKAKRLCKDTISNSSYPSLVQSLDDFVTLIIESSTHLGSLEVDTTLPKDKQKSQGKNIVQQKRKALADLFKYLAKLGLSYRTGLVILSAAGDDLYDFTIPPVDLEAAISYLKNRRCDASLSLLWSGCEKYFQKNIARHRLLSTSMQSPHKDLGVQNIERCNGFTAHLLKLTNSQKKSISKYSRLLCDLRNLTTSLSNTVEIDNTDFNIPKLKEQLEVLLECFAYSSIVLEQFRILLKSLPEKSVTKGNEPEFDNVLSDSKIVQCYKNSDEWSVLNIKIKTILVALNKQKATVNKVLSSVPREITKGDTEIPAVSANHINALNDAKRHLENFKSEVDIILLEYQFSFKSLTKFKYTPQHPVLKSIVELSHYLMNTLQQIENVDEQNCAAMEEDHKEKQSELINETEDLVANMLLIIQSIYKKHLLQSKDVENGEENGTDTAVEDNTKETEETDILEDNHLKEHLQDKLSKDVKMLQLETLINKLHKLLTSYTDFVTTQGQVAEVKNAIMRLVPILEQTVLFVQYFITQKVAVHRVSCKMLSVLLKIFSDLAAKGFCKPSDLDMEDGDGEDGPGKLSSGTGLGDGEGQKDVSDRIENQDQLDDAHRPGDEKKDEERDCKEEEKGVNMTDDFDSHLQDVEKIEGEDSDQDDDNEEADKQMGETDNAAEKLDQQIWGSEDEEDLDEEQSGKEKEDKGKGESTGEKELGAKEEEQGTDDGTDGNDKKNKKDINEMNEPEVDDDHIDPYHGNQEPLPEPEDFELPENMEMDEEIGDDKDGETETENPFEIDITKEDIPQDGEDGDHDKHEEENMQGLEISSDEDNGDETNEDQKDEERLDKEVGPEGDKKDEEQAEPNQEDIQDDADNPEDNQEVPEENVEENKEDIPKNPDTINEEDKVEDKKQDANPQANPSNNDPSAEQKAENAEMETGTDDNVDTNAEQEKDQDAAPYEQSQEQVGDDRQKSGRSELDKSDRGHRGEKQAASRAERSADEQKKYENKPGQTDEERILGEVDDKKHKTTKTLNLEREGESMDDGGEADENAEREADAYQHVKQANKDDLQVIDSATKDQADQQPTLQREEEDGDKLKEDEQLPMDVDDDELQVEKSEELKPEKMKDGTEKDRDKAGSKKEGGEELTSDGVDVEGENVVTTSVLRGRDTSFYTRFEEVGHDVEELPMQHYVDIREWLSSGSAASAGSGVTAGVWRTLWQRCSGDARALCERLRLVLEPTGRARRAGDFRTGRAINMRRVIPYIASHFRKDRIWLRRTKPAKREYKIAIAVDDSSSMADNRSKELAFESLALVSQALNLLESGDLAVLSFGENTKLLHSFNEQFSEHSGSKILEQLRFDQTKTKIAQLLNFSSFMFEEQAIRSDALNAKLLVIVSDGRGIFSEGETKVLQAVRRARQNGVFLVYVIIDNPDNKDSIMDIRRPLLDPVTNSLTGFVSYLDTFPFPFYLILRDMSALPNVLGDAMRQWFELAANTHS